MAYSALRAGPFYGGQAVRRCAVSLAWHGHKRPFLTKGYGYEDFVRLRQRSQDAPGPNRTFESVVPRIVKIRAPGFCCLCANTQQRKGDHFEEKETGKYRHWSNVRDCDR